MKNRALQVYVIDDDPIALRVIERVLRSLGHEVKTRDRALGSLSAVLRDRPDLVVLDLSMPGLSGAGLADLIRNASQKAGRQIGIVVCSGAPQAELEAAAARIGAAGAVAKNLGAAELRAGFAAILSKLEPAA
jgi:two-component system, OmpR family, phosphate regulon response regulator PhoB